MTDTCSPSPCFINKAQNVAASRVYYRLTFTVDHANSTADACVFMQLLKHTAHLCISLRTSYAGARATSCKYYPARSLGHSRGRKSKLLQLPVPGINCPDNKSSKGPAAGRGSGSINCRGTNNKRERVPLQVATPRTQNTTSLLGPPPPPPQSNKLHLSPPSPNQLSLALSDPPPLADSQVVAHLRASPTFPVFTQEARRALRPSRSLSLGSLGSPRARRRHIYIP